MAEENTYKLKTWSKPPLIRAAWLRWLVLVGTLVYLFAAGRTIEVNFSRISRGLDHGVAMVSAFLQPDFTSRGSHIVVGVLESLTMTVVGTIVGIIIAVPISLGAARNISPLPIYMFCRFFLMVLRSLHVVILALLFVIMFGFGPFAGVLTIIFNGVGFIGKLLAEGIENINKKSLEAVRASGASWPQVVIYGVWPQIAARFTGLSIYRADQAFRESTVIGLVGAGGVGAVLNTALGRYDYNTGAAILIVIIVMVLIGEYVSSSLRGRLT
ncbi:phosphonate ABC transporter, permease protein PhnE [Halomonas sp. ML-15]|uniref:phosphonate ABC transporter, permease protein PhnE n=1 Tax=Halomonas sp. ML-15 TaxID=2773305 RepID=UPI0017473EE4|nr:phosphonate ABC transporter, permease protein PhnE [Halomonas sp. ML-15]MBD3896463.1 phosphonate ABC transporter, permease protein PhnE [Halomonas sp. ML-15]